MTTTTAGLPGLDTESCYAAVKSRDRRFDGVFYIAVRTTGIYCRPSCPALTPALQNVTFHRSAAAAQAAGYRACKRCLPDATPGSPDWDAAATVAGRAMRLIADGVVDRDGVDGLARASATRHGTCPGCSPPSSAPAARAGPSATGADRAGAGRDDRPVVRGHRVRFRLRQRPSVQRHRARGLRRDPHALRGRRGGARTPGAIELRLAVRTPFAGAALLRFLAARAVEGVEVTGDGWYARTLDLPHGPGTVRLELGDVLDPGQTALVPARFVLHDLRDTSAAVARVRRLLDGDCDPIAVADHFAGDPVIGPLVRRRPGLRVPGHVAGDEVAVRAVLGQQVSVAGARTVAGKARCRPRPAVHHRHPGPDAPVPRRRDVRGARSRAAADAAGSRPRPDRATAALAAGDVALDRGPDRDDVRRALLALPGIGPWTADYIALRALGHPDIYLPTDVGVRNALTGLGPPRRPRSVGWAPWRSYALLHLWTSLEENS